MLSTLILSVVLQQSGTLPPNMAPELFDVIQAAPNELHHGYLIMEQQLDPSHFKGKVEGLPRGDRQRFVMNELRLFADSYQEELQQVIGDLEENGHVRNAHQMWINNGYVLEGNREAWMALAQVADVAKLRWDPVRDIAELADVPLESLMNPPDATTMAPEFMVPMPEPNIVNHQAPQLWNIGIDGSGVIICNLDDGTVRTHPDLAGAIWANPNDPINGLDDDNNGYIDDWWGWDFVSNDNDPNRGSHGTSTAGIMVGDGTNGFCTGMAPGASLTACALSSESTHWIGRQWAMSVGADVISSSFSYKWFFSPKPDYHEHRNVSDMLLAAGMIHANSIGNQGGSSCCPLPWNISAPGNVPAPWRHPDQDQSGGVSSVMGCAGIVLSDDSYYSPSGRGPCAWEDIRIYDPGFPHSQNSASYWDYPVGGFSLPLEGLLKPDIAGYTLINRTTNTSNGYSGFSGTSAATPHLGGAMCLMVDANEHAPPRQISQALQENAIDKGTVGKDNNWGSGKMQVFDAAMRLIHLVTALDQEPRAGQPATYHVSGPGGRSFSLYASKALGTTSHPGGSLGLRRAKLITTGTIPGSGLFVFNTTTPNKPGLLNATIYIQSCCDDRAGSTGSWLFSLIETVTIRP